MPSKSSIARATRSLTSLLIATTMTLGATSCSSNTTKSSASQEVDSSAEWCDQRANEPLECVAVGTRLTGIVHRGAPHSTDLTLWDPGGPGQGLPDEDMTFTSVIPKPIRNANVLMMVEPWITTSTADVCTPPSFADAIKSGTCDLSVVTSTDSELRDTLTQVDEQLGLTLTSAYLQSFGATRRLPALLRDKELATDWIVLDSPGPPVGADASDLMTARLAEAVDVLSQPCDDAACSLSIRRSIAQLASDEANGRDMTLGLFALASAPTLNESAIAAVADEMAYGKLDEARQRSLVRLGRSYSGQTQGGGIPRAILALWADTCPRLSGWEKLARSTIPRMQAFAWLFRGCNLASIPAERAEAVDAGDTRILMLTGTDDAVVPRRVQELWRQRGLSYRQIVSVGHHLQNGRVDGRVQSWIQRTARRDAEGG